MAAAKSGTVKRLAESTAYVLTTTFTAVSIGFITEAGLKGDTATAVAFAWPTVAAIGIYVVGEALKNAAESIGGRPK